MEEPSRRRSLVGNNRNTKRALMETKEEDGDIDDVELWDTLSDGFKRAQVVLDQNRDLIQRVNDNHRSRIPDNVASNVGLINEINGNISRVMKIYSDLSVDFAKHFDDRPRTAKNSGDATITTTGSCGGGRSSCGS